MSLIDDFRDEMNQSVSIAAVESSGLYGPTYGEATVYSCYVEQEVVNIRDKNGEEAVSHCQIFLDGSVTVGDTDQVTYDGESPPLLRVDARVDDRGNAYSTVVYT